jgi:hypothetical protein
VAFTNGPLSSLLKNRVYLGEINHKGRSWPGDHPAIVDAALFDAVQARLAENLNAKHTRRSRSDALLLGRIFDDAGSRMSPSHARKGPARYRYYVSSVLAQGRKSEAGSVSRVPAHDVERVVVDALRNRMAWRLRAAQIAGGEGLEIWRSFTAADDRTLVAELVERITVRKDRIELDLKSVGEAAPADQGTHPTDLLPASSTDLISIPWTAPITRRRREIVLPDADPPVGIRPMRDAVRANLLTSIARAQVWVEEIVTASGAVDQIAQRERLSERSVRMTINLAFLSPPIVRAIVAGALPRGIGVSRLCDLPASWAGQHRAVGVPPPQERMQARPGQTRGSDYASRR